MNNIFNNDFQDFIITLNKWQVEYILVGGYSVILHGYARTTGDMNIWVNRTENNYRKLTNAFYELGMQVFDMTETNFLHSIEFDVFTFGVPPVSINIMTHVKGLNFKDTFSNTIEHEIDGMKVRLIHLNDLIAAKKSSARPRDINDIENLTKKNKI